MNLKTMMLSQSSQTQKSMYNVLFHLPQVQDQASMIYGDTQKLGVVMVAEVRGGREINRGKV